MPFTLRRAIHTPSSSEPSEAVHRSDLDLNLNLNLDLDLNIDLNFDLDLNIDLNLNIDLTCEMPETKHSPWYVWLSTRTTP